MVVSPSRPELMPAAVDAKTRLLRGRRHWDGEARTGAFAAQHLLPAGCTIPSQDPGVCHHFSLPCFSPMFDLSFLPDQLKYGEDATTHHPANPSNNVTQSCLSPGSTFVYHHQSNSVNITQWAGRAGICSETLPAPYCAPPLLS